MIQNAILILTGIMSALLWPDVMTEPPKHLAAIAVIVLGATVASHIDGRWGQR